MHSSIIDILDAASSDAPDATWLITDDRSWTFAEARAEVGHLAAGLAERGVGSGDRVMVLARNAPAYVFCWFALMHRGAVQVPVNPATTASELAGLVAQVRPTLIIADGHVQAMVTACAAATPVADVVELRSPGTLGGSTPVDLDDVAVMIPTSGTTGRSKLVMQTHRAYVMAGEAFPWWMELGSDDRLMTALPLFHINAPAYSVLGSVAARAGLVLLPSFSPGSFLDAARRHGATEFNAIGAMLEILMRQPQRDDDADTPLRRCYTGPSPTKARQLQIEQRFGIEIVCGYALSESPFGLIWAHGTRPFGTLGTVRQHPGLGVVNEARARDQFGQIIGAGVGELELRNPVIMKGYFEMQEETASVLVDGWLRTGDLVEVNDDATYTFVARVKEVIRRRGENLAPAEVEACLEAHPAVAEAAVVGVASALSEEEVKAFVTPRAGSSIDLVALDHHVSQHLARFKVPRYYEVLAELPHTPTGRIAKHQLALERNHEEIDMEDQR